MHTYWEYLDTPIGILRIEANQNGITYLYLLSDQEEITKPEENLTQNTQAKSIVQETCRQLSEYFAGERTSFDVPIQMEGTPFQQSVWQALREIPYGETRSYKQIAERIQNPKASRAVGMANNKNRILILIPCHRIIGADGSFVGFACGLAAKKYLLNLEKRERVDIHE